MPDFTREELAHIGTVGINQGTKYADVAAFALRQLDGAAESSARFFDAAEALVAERAARALDVEALRELERGASANLQAFRTLGIGDHDRWANAAGAIGTARARIAAWEKDNA